MIGALRFLYGVTLDRPDMVPHLPYPRLKRRQPVVLSAGEVVRLIGAIGNLKHRTVAMVLYGAGLRITEALALELRDVDSARMVLTVRHGKGDQDRQVTLSHVLLKALRVYWRAYRPRSWLFPGKGAEQPLTSATIQRAPFDDPDHVLAYLARYTHRVAISNHRLLHVDDRTVTFRFKDYRSRRARSLTLPVPEFARRFLLHVLPKGFVRIRYYGFLANGSRTRLLASCRRALGEPNYLAEPDPGHAERDQVFLDLLPTALRPCPSCKKGVLRCVQVLERPPPFWHPRRVAA